MITATEDGRQLITSFKHIRPDPANGVPGGTYCYIKVFDSTKKDEEREVIAVGYAQMHHTDKEFNKQIGRKWSLQYALGLNKIALRRQQATGHKPQETIYGTQFTKPQRQVIWGEYWRTHRMGPLNKVARLQAELEKYKSAQAF